MKHSWLFWSFLADFHSSSGQAEYKTTPVERRPQPTMRTSAARLVEEHTNDR